VGWGGGEMSMDSVATGKRCGPGDEFVSGLHWYPALALMFSQPNDQFALLWFLTFL
jgi:hypothetical protein